VKGSTVRLSESWAAPVVSHRKPIMFGFARCERDKWGSGMADWGAAEEGTDPHYPTQIGNILSNLNFW
jgi:hypothetical protein